MRVINIKRIVQRIRTLYFTSTPVHEEQYIKSRNAFAIDGISATTISVLITGAFLAGFLRAMGLPDWLNGIVAAVPALAAFTQPLGAAITQRLERRKLFVCTIALVHRLLFASMFFCIGINSTFGTYLSVTLFMLAHFSGALITPAAGSWIISLTPLNLRGKYFAFRERYNLLISSVVALFAGKMLDVFVSNDVVSVGFIMIGILVLVFTIINFVSLSTCLEPPQPVVKEAFSIKNILLQPLFDEAFRPIIFMNVLYSFTIQFYVPYNNVYLITDLGLEYTFITAIIFAVGIEKAFLVKYWGRIADRKSWAYVCKMSFLILGVGVSLTAFMVKGNAWYLFPIAQCVKNVSFAALNIAIFNIQFENAPLEKRSVYVGANSAITGVVGFTGVLFGAQIMQMTAVHPVLFGVSIAGPQFIAVIASCILMVCAYYVHVAIKAPEAQ